MNSIFILIIILNFSLITSRSTLAQEDKGIEKTGKNVVLPKDQIVDGDYFAAGRSVTVSGSIKGDAYIAAGSIDFEGVVDGDLLAAGGVVNIRGEILDDARLSGGQVIISGIIKGNLTVAGGSVTLTDSARVYGSLILAGRNTNVFAPIGRNVVIGAGDLTIGNRLGGNVRAGVGEMKLTSRAVIEGDLIYYSRSKAQIQKGAEVLGKITHRLPPKIAPRILSPARLFGFGILFYSIFEIVSSLIVGLLLLKFYPNFASRTVEIIRGKSLVCIGVGFLGVVAIPVIFLILIFSIIGIPLGLIIMLSFIIYLYLTKIFISLFIGRGVLRLFGASLKSGWTLLVGLIIYVVITLIPVVGWTLNIIFIFLGFGALLVFYKEVYGKLRMEHIV